MTRGKVARALHIRMKDDGGKILLLNLAAPVLKLYVSEAEEGVNRLVALLAGPCSVNNLCARGAVVGVVKVTLVIKHLAV